MEDVNDLKAQAVAYFQENKIHLRMQDALNVMFLNNPGDPCGFVSTYFEELSLSPSVTRALAVKSIDSKGQSAITTKIYCVSRNKEICIAESHVTIDTDLSDAFKPEDKAIEDSKREELVENAIIFINNDFRDILSSANPKHQQLVDDKIYSLIESRRLNNIPEGENITNNAAANESMNTQEDSKKGGKKSGKGSAKKKGPQVTIIPDKPNESPYVGWHAITAVSQALAIAGASLSKLNLYDYLLSTYGGDEDNIKLPQPVITVFSSGKTAPGKCNCVKEFMIVPRVDMLINEAIGVAAKAQDLIVKMLLPKNGTSIKNLNDHGSLCPQFDKPEQGLDLIADAITQLGFQMGKDFFYVLNVSAQEFFDYEKGKYEVTTGVVRSSDDMPDYWSDLCTRYPSIVGLIDPLRVEEKEQWNKICSAISERCLMITDKAYDRPGLLKTQELDFSQFATSGLVFKLGGPNTITDLISCSKKMIDLENVVMLACGQHETNSTTIIDVAIACQARFVKLGALSRGERIAKYNRLIEIESSLGERRMEWAPLKFPSIPPKAPTPEPVTDN